LVVAQSSSEIPEGLKNNPVFYGGISLCSRWVEQKASNCDGGDDDDDDDDDDNDDDDDDDDDNDIDDSA
jgi:hypothetical protein